MEGINGLEMSQCVICEIPQKGMELFHCCHSICPSCLTSRGGSQIPCPSCGAVSGGDTSTKCEFRNNSFLEYLFEFGESKVSLPNCDICSNRGKDDVPGLYTCYQCGQAMCEGCKKYHDYYSQNKAHTVVLTKDKDKCEGQTQQTCKAHPARPTELFCKACWQFMCMMCPIVESSICPNGAGGKHVCIELNEAINFKRAKLREQAEAIEKELSELKTTVKSLEANLRKVATDGASMKVLILKQKPEIQKELNERTEELLKEADDLADSRSRILEKSLQADQDHMDMKATLCSKLLCAIEYYSPVDLQRVEEKGKAALNIALPLSESSFPEVVYKPNSDLSSLKRALRESLGQLMEKVEWARPKECKGLHDVAYSSFTNSFYVSGAGSGLWQELNGNLQRIDRHPSYGLCTSYDGRVLYSAASTNELVRVFELSKTGDPKEVRSIEVGAQTLNVCLSDGGLLAIVSLKSKKVLLYNQSESFKKQIQGVFCGGQPRYGAWTGEDKLCVTVAIDGGPDKVVCISAECPCILWQVDVDRCWTISFIDNLLYIGKKDAAGVEVISDGRKLGCIRWKGLSRMFPPVCSNWIGPLRGVSSYKNS